MKCTVFRCFESAPRFRFLFVLRAFWQFPSFQKQFSVTLLSASVDHFLAPASFQTLSLFLSAFSRLPLSASNKATKWRGFTWSTIVAHFFSILLISFLVSFILALVWSMLASLSASHLSRRSDAPRCLVFSSQSWQKIDVASPLDMHWLQTLLLHCLLLFPN